jgi:hypothetical protein
MWVYSRGYVADIGTYGGYDCSDASWFVAELAQLDHGEAEVRTAGHHGPEQFPDGLTVRETHGAFKVLAFGVGRRAGCW